MFFFLLLIWFLLSQIEKHLMGAMTFSNTLRIFQRFRLVKFIEKFKTRVKNLKIEKIIAFDKYLHERFFTVYFHLSKDSFLTLENNKVADLTTIDYILLFYKMRLFLKFLKITKRWIVVKRFWIVSETPISTRNSFFDPHLISIRRYKT